MQTQSRNGKTGPVDSQFASPEPDLARAENLIHDGSARHMDDAARLQHLIAVDAVRDRRAKLMMQCVEKMEAGIERRRELFDGMQLQFETLRELHETDKLAVTYIRTLLERRAAEDPEHDDKLEELLRNQVDGLEEHREAAGILERRQRTGRASAHVRVENATNVDVTVEAH